MVKLIFRVFASLLLAFALGGCASLKTNGTVTVSGSSVAYAHAGQGGPTIVLQSGLGDDSAPWVDVYRALQQRHSVLAFDRPGYGASAAVADARDPCTIATQTRALLAAAGLKPPYVLVGHSLGGLYQYAFARLYPDEVAGLVLLDPTHPQHWQTMQREAPAAASALLAIHSTLFSATARREFDQQSQCVDQLEVAAAHPVPVRILVSTQSGAMEGPDFQRMLARLRQDWLRLSGAASLELVPGAGHYLQREAPGAVERAVEDVAARSAAR